MAILVVSLLAAMVSFVVMGGKDGLRSRRLQRLAQDHAIRYSRDDPFDLPQVYESFLLMRVGHSARACHVLHGQAGSTPLRLFDFRCETGHGTHRQTREYGVLVLQLPTSLPPILLWSDHDSQATPLEIRRDGYRLSPWSALGGEDQIHPLAARLEEHIPCPFSLEIQGQLAMFFVPMQAMDLSVTGQWLEQIPRLQEALCEVPGQPDASAGCNV